MVHQEELRIGFQALLRDPSRVTLTEYVDRCVGFFSMSTK